MGPSSKRKIRSGAGSMDLEIDEGPGTPREPPPWWKGEDPIVDNEGMNTPTYAPESPGGRESKETMNLLENEFKEVSKEWKPEPYIYDRKAAKESIMTFEEELALGLHDDDEIIQEELKMRSEMFQRKKKNKWVVISIL